MQIYTFLLKVEKIIAIFTDVFDQGTEKAVY
jgi:hypothetical protein